MSSSDGSLDGRLSVTDPPLRPGESLDVPPLLWFPSIDDTWPFVELLEVELELLLLLLLAPVVALLLLVLLLFSEGSAPPPFASVELSWLPAFVIVILVVAGSLFDPVVPDATAVGMPLFPLRYDASPSADIDDIVVTAVAAAERFDDEDRRQDELPVSAVTSSSTGDEVADDERTSSGATTPPRGAGVAGVVASPVVLVVVAVTLVVAWLLPPVSAAVAVDADEDDSAGPDVRARLSEISGGDPPSSGLLRDATLGSGRLPVTPANVSPHHHP